MHCFYSYNNILFWLCCSRLGVEGTALRGLAIESVAAEGLASRIVVAEGPASGAVAFSPSERVLIAAETRAILQRTMTMEESLAELTNLRAVHKPGQNPQLGVLKNSEVIPLAEIEDSKVIV